MRGMVGSASGSHVRGRKSIFQEKGRFSKWAPRVTAWQRERERERETRRGERPTDGRTDGATYVVIPQLPRDYCDVNGKLVDDVIGLLSAEEGKRKKRNAESCRSCRRDLTLAEAEVRLKYHEKAIKVDGSGCVGGTK